MLLHWAKTDRTKQKKKEKREVPRALDLHHTFFLNVQKVPTHMHTQNYIL